MYVLDEIDRLRPIIGDEKVASLKSAFLLEDETGRKRIIEIIDAIKALIMERDDFKDTLLITPPEETISLSGNIEIGTVLYGKRPMYPYTLNEDALLTHIGIFGSSGYGKTNLIYWLVNELNKKEIPIIIFDFSKRNYRDLLTIPELKDKIQIYTVGRLVSPFRFNPLIPPEKIELTQWIKEFAEIFDHAYWLLGGGRHIIMKALDEIYKQKENPKISDIKDWLEKYSAMTSSAREKNWLSTAERPMESLCFREIGDIFECDKGIEPKTFFEKGKITILELDALSTNDRTFFIEIMLQWLRDWLITTTNREKLMGVIVVEEAHHILNREKAKRLGMETVTDLIFREIRELGIGIIYADQHPSLVSYPALGNTSIHIYMNLGLDTKTSSDIIDAANMMGLKTDDEIDYLRRLPVGTAFLINRKSEFSHPFLIQFPYVDLQRGSITDDDIKSIMQGKVVELYKKIKFSEPIETEKQTDNISIDANMWNILETIGTGKASYSSEIYKQLKMSGSTFKKIIQKMIDFGLVYKKNIRIYKQNLIYYFLTTKGKELFEKRFGSIDIKDSFLTQDKDLIEQRFVSEGWELILKDNNNLLFKKNKRKLNVRFVESNSELVLNINDILENEIIFVYSKEENKNKIIQRLIEFSLKKRINFQFSVVNIEEAKKEKTFKLYQLL
ncbi:MAG: DUF87 domain-containing protein [Candidatus Aenigmarchaeota archaeon]|nr:DUF87 domain-containing protein [Candidatus Aenigmarchaeota archaeon]